MDGRPIRHVLPGVGVLPRDFARDGVSGLVGAAFGFAHATVQMGAPVELWGLAHAAAGPRRYVLDGVRMRGLRPGRVGRLGPVDLRYPVAAAGTALFAPSCDLLHVHALPTLLLLPKARRRVLHLHMALGRADLGEAVLVARADAVVCASAYLAASFRQNHPWYPGLVRVIRNGVDLRRYADPARGQAVRRQLGIPAEQVVVVYAGQVAPEKGVQHLLAALAALPAPQRPTVLIAGSSRLWRSTDTVRRRDPTPFEQELRERSAGLPVHWLGNVPVADMPAVLLAADLVCCPSVVAEGLATINLEAAAAGKPVLASRVGGIPEIVQDGATGLLVPPGDWTALAGALARLSADRAWRVRLGEAARHGARTWDQAGAELRALYVAIGAIASS